MIGAIGNGLGRRGHAFLIPQGGTGGPHTRCNDEFACGIWQRTDHGGLLR